MTFYIFSFINITLLKRLLFRSSEILENRARVNLVFSKLIQYRNAWISRIALSSEFLKFQDINFSSKIQYWKISWINMMTKSGCYISLYIGITAYTQSKLMQAPQLKEKKTAPNSIMNQCTKLPYNIPHISIKAKKAPGTQSIINTQHRSSGVSLGIHGKVQTKESVLRRTSVAVAHNRSLLYGSRYIAQRKNI